MVTPTFAPDQETPYTSSLNETFGRVAGDIVLRDDTFNNILRALEGIQAITQIIIANGVAKENLEDAVMNNNLVGGLESAISALTHFSIGKMEEVAMRHDKAQRGVSHE